MNDGRTNSVSMMAMVGPISVVHMESRWSTRLHQVNQPMRLGPSAMARPLVRSMLPNQRRIRSSVDLKNRRRSGNSSKPVT